MSENRVAFYMWLSFRQSLIDKHLFYLSQARKRLLSQFEDMETDSQHAADEWLEKHSKSFDPDRDDVGDFYESAYEIGIEHHELLTDMRDQTRLSVVAGMFHEWEKQLRNWAAKELRRSYGRDTVIEQVWRLNFGGLIELLECYGWSVRSQQFYGLIDACRCVVNVYKHGNGGSLGELKKKYPNYLIAPASLSYPSLLDIEFLDYTYVKVSDAQLQQFSSAIIEFWTNIPERLYGQDGMDVPNWLGKALQ